MLQFLVAATEFHGYATELLFDSLSFLHFIQKGGGPLANQGVVQEAIANSRIEIDQARLLTLHAAWLMDTVGNKGARGAISAIKVAVPSMAGRVIDRAIQIHGAAGLSQDFPLAQAFAHQRVLRLADGPDEVHSRAVARLELAKH